MKLYLTYDILKDICLHLVDKVKDNKFDEVVAISRGGLTAAHIIAKELRLPIGFFIPNKNQLILNNENSKKILVIEDLIAKGRTYSLFKDYMFNNYKKIDFIYVPIIIDKDYENNEISLYPNPCNEIINFNYASNGSDNITVNITDITGKIITQYKLDLYDGINTNKLDLSSLNSGVYLLQAINDDKVDNFKIVKE